MLSFLAYSPSLSVVVPVSQYIILIVSPHLATCFSRQLSKSNNIEVFQGLASSALKTLVAPHGSRNTVWNKEL